MKKKTIMIILTILLLTPVGVIGISRAMPPAGPQLDVQPVDGLEDQADQDFFQEQDEECGCTSSNQ